MIHPRGGGLLASVRWLIILEVISKLKEVTATETGECQNTSLFLPIDKRSDKAFDQYHTKAKMQRTCIPRKLK